MLEIYVDGGCWPNPGNGAWAVAVIHNGELIHKECHPEMEVSTNNICEIKAILKALYIAKNLPDKVIIKSDSQYAINSITRWALTWKKNGWVKKHGEIKNIELIKEAHYLWNKIRSRVEVKWIKGHSGNQWNELCDQMCAEAIKRIEEIYFFLKVEYNYTVHSDQCS